MLGDDAGAVLVEFGERESRVTKARRVVVGEEGVVAAGGLGAAFQDVTGDDGAGEAVVRVRRPAEVGDGGPGDQRRVGDPTGHHDVRALAQTGGDPGTTEVGVRGEAPGVAGGQVVALDVGDAHRYAEAVGQLPYGVGESGGVEAARVRHDPHAPLVREAEALLQLALEGAGVAAGGFLRRSRPRMSMVSSAR